MTCVGTWVPAGPSRNAAVWPLTCVFNEGNWERTQAISKAGVARTFKPGVVISLFSGESKIAIVRELVSHTGGGRCTSKPVPITPPGTAGANRLELRPRQRGY